MLTTSPAVLASPAPHAHRRAGPVVLLVAWVQLVIGASMARGDGVAVSDARIIWPAAIGARPTVEFVVSWNNAWRNARNHDGAWCFAKVGRADRHEWLHASLASAAAEWAGDGPGVAAECRVAADGAGVFVYPAAEHRGPARWRVRLVLSTEEVAHASDRDAVGLAVGAIEMVYVPRGAFFVGDVGGGAQGHAAFYRSGADGRPAGLFRVESEAEIAVGPAEGSLYYSSPAIGRPRYGGDQAGPVPAEFPKGFRAFWCMKYELSQGQYAMFLNGLTTDQTAFRAVHGVRGYQEGRGTISLIDGRYVAESPHRAAVFTSWDDGCAFADWAALRPMTELEFTKACRGPTDPPARDYPWGTTSTARLARVVGPDMELASAGGADESRLTDETREVFGASYWWVMDLAGSVWERCVTIGHPAGRSFAGSHGDGRLTGYGRATNTDWPRGDEGAGGYGYRGGGWYGPDHRYEPDGFNPHSPTEWRRFGSWGDGPRTTAYGFRAVRTAE